MVQSKQKIRSKELYGIMELARILGRNHRTVKKIVDIDIAGKDILCAMVSGEGRLKRYAIPRANIKRFKRSYDPEIKIFKKVKK